MSYCDELDDSGMVYFKEMYALRSLCFDYCPRFTSVGMNHLSSLVHLEELELGNTRFVSVALLSLTPPF